MPTFIFQRLQNESMTIPVGTDLMWSQLMLSVQIEVAFQVEPSVDREAAAMIQVCLLRRM